MSDNKIHITSKGTLGALCGALFPVCISHTSYLRYWQAEPPQPGRELCEECVAIASKCKWEGDVLVGVKKTS